MLIALEGMRFFAYHGFYEEEQSLGGQYILDVFMDVDTEVAAADDDLSKTINYETVFEVCKIQMKEPQKLIESVIQNIVFGLEDQFHHIRLLNIKLKKLNPPLSGRVDAASVESTNNFVRECARCGEEILCYQNKFCWCNQDKVHVHPRTLEMLAGQHKGCLCSNCLRQYAG